jgi:hypothetical protein
VRSLRDSSEQWTAIWSGFPSTKLIRRFSPILCWVRLSTWFKQRNDIEDSGADKNLLTTTREDDSRTWKLEKTHFKTDRSV